MFGPTEQDSFGANWKADDYHHGDNDNGGYLYDDIANYLKEETISKHTAEVSQKKSYMPIKINMIYSSWKTGASHINIFGYQIEMIKLVGNVKDAKQTEQEATFLIDDGTGSIECVYLFPPTMTEWKKKYMANLTQTTSLVKVYGEFNPLYSSTGPTIMIYSIKELSTPQESKLHDLDVVYAILLNDGRHNPKVLDALSEMDEVLKQFNIVAASKADDSAEEAQVSSGPTSSTDMKKIPANEIALTKFISSILAFESRNNNYNGLHISEIVKRCKQQHSFQSVQEQHVKKILADLEKDASVYQTLDSNTYASTDS